MNSISQLKPIKNDVLINLVKAFLSEDFKGNTNLIPSQMRPEGTDAKYRSSIEEERNVIKDRIIAGLGFSLENVDREKSLADYAQMALDRTELEKDPITVLKSACNACKASHIYVTDLCQGCVARPCENTCKFGAITVENGKSRIDNEKCKKCKMCIAACPYQAIAQTIVPCEAVCPVGALSKDENGVEQINYDICISCGKCVAACPFGVMHEKSQIIDILKSIKSDKKVIAMIAPSIVGQFAGNIYQLKTAIMKAGFDDVYEVAQGADVTTRNEAKEFEERMAEGHNFMTTSCCAGYNNLRAKHLTEINPYVSDTKTPLYYTAEIVKEKFPDAITVFVSPCVAKRKEGMDNEKVDYILNYEELYALFSAKEINVADCEESQYDVESSKQGRTFGKTGGVAASIEALSDKPKPCVINGITKESIKQLKKFAKDGVCPDCNIVEVMCCEGGCMGGNATIEKIRTADKALKELTSNSKDIEK